MPEADVPLLVQRADARAAVARWQAAFDDGAALFTELRPGARMGLIAGGGSAPAGRRVAGIDAALAKDGGTPMLAFTAVAGRIEVAAAHFDGFAQADVDLLFVADGAAGAELAATPPGAVLSAMKRLLRRGNLMFYVFRTKHELQDAGYEDFLDSLGLAFLGACR